MMHRSAILALLDCPNAHSVTMTQWNSPDTIIFLNSFAQGVKQAYLSDVLFQLKFPLPDPN